MTSEPGVISNWRSNIALTQKLKTGPDANS